MSGKPIGRERNVVDGEAKVERQGEGLGQGPVGNREGNTGLGGQNRPGPGRPGAGGEQQDRPEDLRKDHGGHGRQLFHRQGRKPLRRHLQPAGKNSER